MSKKKNRLKPQYLIAGLAILLFLIGLYLNRTYANFFNRIGEQNLKSPFQAEQYIFWNSNSTKTTNILILGDSLAAGVGSQDLTKTLPYLLAENLATDSSNLLIIKAIPGAKLENLELSSELTSQNTPDKVFILSGINDVFARTPTDKFKSNLRELVTNLKETKSEIYLFTIPYLGPKSSVPFPYDKLYDNRLQAYNQQISNLAQEENIRLIDLYTLTKPTAKDSSLYSSDGFHPNEKGYILWSELVLSELRK